MDDDMKINNDSTPEKLNGVSATQKGTSK